jgi:putative ABC transport system permease protein
MCDWHRHVRNHLSVPGLKEARERDIIAEVASQLEDVYLEALSRGRSPEEAKEAALAHIPDWGAFSEDLLRAERSRRRARGDAWTEGASEAVRRKGGRWVGLADLLQDLRYSLRILWSSPGFTALAILTLALGIGGAATIFTLYDQVLLRPLPYRESDQLVQLWEKLPSFENASVSYANFVDWRERNRVFEEMGVWNETRMSLTGSGDPEEVLLGRVSASIFPLLGVAPIHGRDFLLEDDRLGASPVVILSHSFWRDRFGEDPSALGRTLYLDGYPAEVVGILPPNIGFPPNLADVDMYVPVELFAEDWIHNRSNHPALTGLARLLPGVTLEQARGDMDRVAMELEAEFADTNEGSRVHVVPLKDRVVLNARNYIPFLLLAVSLLLLIACINVAGLILARATGRAREVAVRVSLGAGHRRILRLLLTETLILWFLGGLLGLVLAVFGVRGVTTLLAEQIPPVFRIGLDLRIVLLLLALTLTTGLAFGLPPALRLVKRDLREFLGDGVRTGLGMGRSRFRSGLVVAEVSLAVALLAGTGLTARSFSKMVRTSPGIDPMNVLVAEINLPDTRYADPEDRSRFFDQLLERVQGHPGVLSAATAYTVPLGPGGWQNGYHVEGEPPEEGGQGNFSEVNSVSTDYFRTMGIPLLRGRVFTREDNADASPVIIVAQDVAERFWPGEDPLGKRIKWGGFDSGSPWMEVVGVAGEVRVNGVAAEALPQTYIPHWQDNDNGYYMVIKTWGEPLNLAEPLREMVLGIDPELPISSIGTMEGFLRETTRTAELLALLMTLFSGAAILLAGVGIYGVMAQMTAERRHEIGIRVALGARSDQVLRMVFRQGLVMVGTGVVMGLGLAAVVGRLVSSQLYQVSALDPLTFALTPLLVGAVALTANLLPARWATKVDPVRALQAE